MTRSKKFGKIADVSTFHKNRGAMTLESNIRSSWCFYVFRFFAHLSAYFQAVLSDFKIRLLQI